MTFLGSEEERTAIGTGSCLPQNICNHNCAYGKCFSDSRGVLAKETITLTSTSGKPLKIVVLGCGHENIGTSNEKNIGIFGLEEGLCHSLVSQLGSMLGG